MNPLAWLLKWCNPNHIALKMTVLAASTDRMLMIEVDDNTCDEAASDKYTCKHICVSTQQQEEDEKKGSHLISSL